MSCMFFNFFCPQYSRRRYLAVCHHCPHISASFGDFFTHSTGQPPFKQYKVAKNNNSPCFLHSYLIALLTMFRCLLVNFFSQLYLMPWRVYTIRCFIRLKCKGSNSICCLDNFLTSLVIQPSLSFKYHLGFIPKPCTLYDCFWLVKFYFKVTTNIFF